jgi:4-alpha-glucanotransferase
MKEETVYGTRRRNPAAGQFTAVPSTGSGRWEKPKPEAFISLPPKEAGQSWWQILPTGPTGYGDSPYQSFSSFAGNPYLIDFDDLLEHGLLKKEEYDAADWGDDPTAVDYYRISLNRGNVLKKAVRRLLADPPEDFSVFLEKNRYWLPDYALFMAEKG